MSRLGFMSLLGFMLFLGPKIVLGHLYNCFGSAVYSLIFAILSFTSYLVLCYISIEYLEDHDGYAPCAGQRHRRGSRS